VRTPSSSFWSAARGVTAARALVGLVFVFALVVAGCTGSGRIRHESAEEAYTKGMTLYEDGKYDKAALYFRSVFSYGRANPWADDAQLALGHAYREQKQYLLAATEYRRFTQIYRNSPMAPEAAFQRAMMYYRRSPMHKLDQSDTRKAISYFLLFLEQYPRHELADDAEARVGELRNKLAHKMADAGALYERRKLYRAAAETYASLFDQYPDTDYADDALLGAMRSYLAYADLSVFSKKEERLTRALQNYERLVQVFPDSPLLDEAEDLRATAEDRLDDVRARKARRAKNESLADN
jgi:outer membrane protein assembly factor BamD